MALKMLSKSVKDLSSISEMSDISKSTSDILTGQAFKKSALRQKFKALSGDAATGKRKKSESRSSLIHSSVGSLSTISDVDVRQFSFILLACLPANIQYWSILSF